MVDPSFEKPTIAQRIKASPLSFAIAAINVAWFVWAEKHGSTDRIDILLRFGAVEPNLVRAGEYWRVASYMFLHIGWAHLLINTWAGLSWCVAIERLLGWRRFLFVYLFAGIGGGVACVMFSKAVTAGASGAMFGIIGSLLSVQYHNAGSFQAFTADRRVRATVGQIAIWTVLGVVALPMSQAGHFGGLITGALATLVLIAPPQRRTTLGAGLAVAFIAFTVVAIRPWERGAPLDWTAVQLGRLGQPTEQTERVEAEAPAACQKGVERACVVDGIANLALDKQEQCSAQFGMFSRACAHGDQDACAAEGQQIVVGCGTKADAKRGEAIVRYACEHGSEYACEFKP